MADWRAFVGDPGFVDVPTAALLSKEYARKRAAGIDPDRAEAAPRPGGPFAGGSPSTTFLAAADRAGNMVALTQTISDFFGAKVCPAGTGIILNNELKNFSADGPNALKAGKRMRTTISPTLIVRRGRAFAALGTPGAARILATTPILVSNLIDFGMGIQEAIESPRFFPAGGTLEYEPRFPRETAAALEKKGHTLKPHEREFDLYFGGAQGIVIDPKTRKLVGGADPRRDGAVAGF
jgi:gamma-glutamyltranspeptidase/glutathione hydrolase